MDTMEKLQFDLELYGMSSVTQKNYVYHASKFASHCGKELVDVEIADVRQFLHYLRNYKKLNIGTVNYYHTCLKFLFQVTLEKTWNDWKLPRLRGYRTLPVILAREEVINLIASTDNLRSKALISTIYSGGLRISEACRLKVQDIDSKNMQLFIRKGKGNKDRYTILSQKNLLLLREYWKQCGRPKDWLFPGQKPGMHITPVSVREFLKTACQKAGIKKPITVHTLRHCFATHMLESGVSIFAIKILL
jgi:site-specific recombinase XerD